MAVALGLFAAEAVVLARRRGTVFAVDAMVRCQAGHLFTTYWIPGGSLKAIRLGPVADPALPGRPALEPRHAGRRRRPVRRRAAARGGDARRAHPLSRARRAGRGGAARLPSRAPVAQWIEHRSPEPGAQVRFLPGASGSTKPKGAWLSQIAHFDGAAERQKRQKASNPRARLGRGLGRTRAQTRAQGLVAGANGKVWTRFALGCRRGVQSPQSSEREADLVRRAVAGDARAWELIVGEHRRAVWRTAYLIVGRRVIADEVMRDVFLQAFAAFATFESGRQLRSVAAADRRESRAERRARGAPCRGARSATAARGAPVEWDAGEGSDGAVLTALARARAGAPCGDCAALLVRLLRRARSHQRSTCRSGRCIPDLRVHWRSYAGRWPDVLTDNDLARLMRDAYDAFGDADDRTCAALAEIPHRDAPRERTNATRNGLPQIGIQGPRWRRPCVTSWPARDFRRRGRGCRGPGRGGRRGRHAPWGAPPSRCRLRAHQHASASGDAPGLAARDLARRACRLACVRSARG